MPSQVTTPAPEVGVMQAGFPSAATTCSFVSPVVFPSIMKLQPSVVGLISFPSIVSFSGIGQVLFTGSALCSQFVQSAAPAAIGSVSSRLRQRATDKSPANSRFCVFMLCSSSLFCNAINAGRHLFSDQDSVLHTPLLRVDRFEFLGGRVIPHQNQRVRPGRGAVKAHRHAAGYAV